MSSHPYITIDANGQISRAEPPARYKRPGGVDAGLFKAVAFVALMAWGTAALFGIVVSLAR